MRYWLVAAWLALSLFTSVVVAQPARMRAGVLPYLSPRTLLLEFAPFRDFLAQALQRQVEIQTAPDLPRFLQRTHDGDFDLVLTAPHFARLAQRDHGFVPLVAIRADFYALLLVPKNSSIQTLRQLVGKTLHVPHRLSFVSFQMEDFLQQRGVEPEFDLILRYHSTDNNAILAGERYPDSAAVAQRSVFEAMPKEITEQLRILGSTQSAISLIVMAHPRVSDADVRALKDALGRFPYSPQGLKFFQTSHTEFIPADPPTMGQLDVYLDRLKTRLILK